MWSNNYQFRKTSEADQRTHATVHARMRPPAHTRSAILVAQDHLGSTSTPRCESAPASGTLHSVRGAELHVDELGGLRCQKRALSNSAGAELDMLAISDPSCCLSRSQRASRSCSMLCGGARTFRPVDASTVARLLAGLVSRSCLVRGCRAILHHHIVALITLKLLICQLNTRHSPPPPPHHVVGRRARTHTLATRED